MLMQSLPPSPLSPIPAGSWWHRNWKWVVPLSCCSAVGLFVGGIALIIAAAFGTMRSSGACQEAVARAAATPAVVQALGSPIEIGWFVTGTLDPGRRAEITIPVSGSRGQARIDVVASKADGKWAFSTLTVKLRATGEQISLVEQGPRSNPAPQPAAPNIPTTP
jgi:hypothetical protein